MVIAVLLAVVSGCATAGPGTAAPVSTSAEPSEIALPPRPREVRIDGIDPCSLLTADQRAELGLDGRPVAYTSANGLFGEASSCSIRGTEPREVSVGLSVVTDRGIEIITSSGGVTDELTGITVAGFPAVLARPTRLRDFCSVEIDVAAGQLLDIQFAQGTRGQPIPQDHLCRDAQRVAEAAIASLLTR
ncbi:DUF3558 domain-containing protein [Pseudonocardia bannensis]|uniref:DUF3558 domain-containing protein n=1 Tax=Pseudonocardia bannensis TaxID=630973 RepID=A0A848DP84_9PSEU|nr:DUF3558 domain-containing protein [Pseudonocardia bannensis]NMH94627.1 DUF3558 domain-containing protein [Pseudonocardia bannensis]